MFNTAILLGTLTGILLVVGFLIGGVLGMGIALTFAVVINLVSYWYSDRIVLKMYKAKPSKREDLNEMVERLALEAKIPKPRVYEVKTKVPNAFATGRSPKHAAVVVTEGLLDLDKDEIEGVLAHELGHIKNRDILVSTLAATIAGAIAFLAQMGYWSLFMGAGGRRSEGNIIGLILIIIFAPIAALLVRMAISRAREYRADRTGVLLSKNPRGLASALRRISEFAERNPLRGSSATSHMWIVNPFHRDWFTGLFSTHPPLRKRIERLEEMHVG